MKQLSVAISLYDVEHGHLPVRAIRSKDGRNLLSWRVQMLPGLEQGHLYREFKLDEPWDSDHNKKLIAKMPKVFAPEGIPSEGKTRYLAVVGPKTVFGAEKPISLTQEDIPDGLGRTAMIVEVGPDKAVIWTKPDDFNYDQDDPIAALGDIDEEGFLVLWSDWRISRLPNIFEPDELKAMFTRNAGDYWPVEKIK